MYITQISISAMFVSISKRRGVGTGVEPLDRGRVRGVIDSPSIRCWPPVLSGHVRVGVGGVGGSVRVRVGRGGAGARTGRGQRHVHPRAKCRVHPVAHNTVA